MKTGLSTAQQSKTMVKDPIKAKNATYYFRANLGYDSKGK